MGFVKSYINNKVYPKMKNLVSRYSGTDDKFGDAIAEGFTGVGNCGYFDGGTHLLVNGTAQFDNATINNCDTMCISFYSSLPTNGQNAMFNTTIDLDGNDAINPSYFLLYPNGTAYWSLGGIGMQTSIGGYSDNNIHFIEIKYDKTSNYTSFNIDGNNVDGVSGVPLPTTNQIYTHFGKYVNSYLDGVMFGFKLTVNNNILCKFDMNNQFGGIIYDSSIYTEVATLIGANQNIFWSKSQYVYNALDKVGYSLYRHNSDPLIHKDILVPFEEKTNVEIVDTIVDYTKIDVIRGRLKYDINLINSPNGVWDGNGYALGGTKDLHPSSYLEFEVIFKEKIDTAEQPLVNKWDLNSKRSFYIASKDRHILFATSHNGVNQQNVTAPPLLVVGKIYHLKGIFDNGNLSGTIQELNVNGDVSLNGITQPFSFILDNSTLSLGNNDIPFVMGKLLSRGIPISRYTYTDAIYYVKYGTAEFDINHMNGNILYNKNINGENCELIGFNLKDFWKGRQNFLHPAYNNGFDKWSNGINDIQVPIGISVTQTGYTFVSSHPQIGGHNGAKTDYQLSKAHQITQDITPISSLTNNKNLRWKNGSVIGYVMTASGTSTITNEGDGTLINSPNGDFVSLTNNIIVDIGTSYDYIINCSSVIGFPQAIICGVVVTLANGLNKGTITSTSGVIIQIKRSGISAVKILDASVWEKSTIPPLSFDELDQNSKNTTFCDVSDPKNKKNLTIYKSPLTDAESIPLKKYLNQI